MVSAEYRGRFAPPPTGPLHFGSLIAAVASYLDARAHGGKWLVRMEDVDEPRTVPGAAADILRTLEAFGFAWDGPVIYQTERTEAYRDALEKLRRDDMAYPCSCSRRETGGPVYPGTCRAGIQDSAKPFAWRVRVEDVVIGFEDRMFGRSEQSLASDTGDFVVLRSDGLFAYQMAVVVDDAAQGITDIIRGADLLDSTPRQIWLQRLLGLPKMRYLHVPIVTNTQGEKLSKQTQAPALCTAKAADELRAALTYLGQSIPEGKSMTPAEILGWAVPHWRARPQNRG